LNYALKTIDPQEPLNAYKWKMDQKGGSLMVNCPPQPNLGTLRRDWLNDSARDISAFQWASER